MIKYLNYRPFVNEAEGKPYVECTGLSTDTKPNEVSLNSLFLELDTKTLYYCSKSGGESEEVVFEGEVGGGLTPKTLDASLFGDTIIVTWDGKEYTCEKREYELDGVPVYEWGAPRVETEDEGYDYDYSVVPFVILLSRRTFVYCADENTHSISISSLNKTDAEWVKYGESGGSSGMINVYYLNNGQEVTELTSQVAQGESITLPLYNGASTNFKPFYANSTEKGSDIPSGDTFTPTDEYIFTEVPSSFPVSGATVPFVCFSVVTFG